MHTRVSQNAPTFILASDIVHVAVSIPQEPPKKISWVLGHFCGVATIFGIYKGNSEKYKGKYAIGPFLLSFLKGRSNWLNSLARLLHFYCFFRQHPYWPSLMPYSHMASNGINMGVFWNSSINAAIWRRNYVNSTFLLEMKEKMVRWHIFLRIFPNFLCKHKKWWPLYENALKLMKFLLVAPEV